MKSIKLAFIGSVVSILSACGSVDQWAESITAAIKEAHQ
ncbi:hypothetical protein ambt_20895 [Alteromonas naphthalenivorans]|uniref:Uncharacterized protein n=1 Tax=Alteromonas naphthalenivorans TaxID=715451 RepID=F5Z707_ALTNA|nr:hypothetical protein ambt_20895 [Alteromonas naphthalenivorans]